MGEGRSRSVNDKLLERKVVARAAVMFRCIRGSSSVAGGWLPGKGLLTLHFHPGENFTGAITRDDMTLLFYLKSRARRGKSRLPVTGLCRSDRASSSRAANGWYHFLRQIDKRVR